MLGRGLNLLAKLKELHCVLWVFSSVHIFGRVILQLIQFRNFFLLETVLVIVFYETTESKKIFYIHSTHFAVVVYYDKITII